MKKTCTASAEVPTRTEASQPAATEHLDAGQKQALDIQGDAEHTDGREREKLTEKMEKLGGGTKPRGG